MSQYLERNGGVNYSDCGDLGMGGGMGVCQMGEKVVGVGVGKGELSNGKKGVVDAFLASLSMILVTEVN